MFVIIRYARRSHAYQLALEKSKEEAEKLARALGAGPTRSFGSVKKLLCGTYSESLETQMELEARGIADMSKTADAREGVGAFLARRKPVFTGA
jgi:2-(1,2-epoxy-1,2-dihydrophenyl)acetyl-CoA isomerase